MCRFAQIRLVDNLAGPSSPLQMSLTGHRVNSDDRCTLTVRFALVPIMAIRRGGWNWCVPMSYNGLVLCESIEYICNGLSNRMAPRMHGRVGSAFGNDVKERNELEPNALLVVANLVEVGLCKVEDVLGGTTPVYKDFVCMSDVRLKVGGWRWEGRGMNHQAICWPITFFAGQSHTGPIMSIKATAWQDSQPWMRHPHPNPLDLWNFTIPMEMSCFRYALP